MFALGMIAQQMADLMRIARFLFFKNSVLLVNLYVIIIVCLLHITKWRKICMNYYNI